MEGKERKREEMYLQRDRQRFRRKERKNARKRGRERYKRLGIKKDSERESYANR